MAKDEAYRKAEKKIEEVLRSGATELDLSWDYSDESTKLTELPESLGQLTQLQTLSLSYNQLAALPESLGQLTQLQELYLSGNELTVLPKSLGQLTQLQTLDLSGNQLTVLSESLGQLTQLEMLMVSNNHLTNLPEAVSKLASLSLFYVGTHEGGNPLEKLPDCLRSLNGLRYLDVVSCGLSELPAWIGDLERLSELDATNNNLTDVPSSIVRLEKLLSGTRFYLADNPLNPELAAAYEQGLEAVKAYLRAKAEDQIVLNEAKLILIGEGEVGKTSLLGALRGDEWVENRPTTHGVEVDIKSLVLDVHDHSTLPPGGSRGTSGEGDTSERVEGTVEAQPAQPSPGLRARPSRREGNLDGSGPKTITLNGWDFGGQNIYRHTHQLFFTAPAVYLAVWNPRRGPEQCCVDEWIKMVKQRAYDESRPDERPRILVVATHGGPQERSAHIDEQLLRDEFGDLVVGFHHVDSKTGHGLDELKAAIAAAASKIPSVGRSVPTSWKNTLDALRKRSEKDPYISYKQFCNLSRRHKVTNDLADTYAAILNELGHLIHYRGDAELQDTVILKPDWLSKAISYVLEDDQSKEQNGLVEHDRLRQIWNNPQRPKTERYPKKLHAVFLKLMERFDLSYRVAMPEAGAPATSLVAQLVPGGRPEGWQRDWPSQPTRGDAERKRICRIVDAETGRTAEVEGLLYRLIVRLHRYSLGRSNYFDSRHWKTGMILDDGINGRAFIEEIAGDIYVSVRAAYPDGFLGNLCAEIEWLVDYFWKGLDCRRSVPCHPPCKGLHEVKGLVETKREGIPKVRCSVCEKFHEIDSLLLAATAKLPMEVVLAELKKVRTDLANVKRGVADLDTDVRLMVGQANEQFELFMKALTDPAKDGPRLFSFEPVEPGFWDKPMWIAEKFRLTLWCEHSRLPLPLLTGEEKLGVYEVELSKDWVKRSAPFLKVLSGTLSLALPIAAPAAKLAMDAAAFDAIENQLDFGKTCAESFLDASDKVGDWLTSDDDTELEFGRAKLAQGAELRELHALLKAKDSANRFGDLARVQNKRREFLWVHPQFASEY